MLLLISVILILLSVFAMVVGNYVAMLICFISGFLMFFPTCYIKVRRMMGVD